ncbi:MAG: L,D-transpeptidase family protein [Gemmatimonadota bacterium]
MTGFGRITLACVLAIAAAACGRADKATATPEARARIRAVLENADSATIISLIAGDTLHLSDATIDFYQRRRWRPAWADEELTDQGTRIVQVLGATEQDGLSPLRYRYDVLRRMVLSLDNGAESLDETAQPQYAADLDILLTEAFARYALDLAQGTLSPDSAGLDWEIPRGGVPKENLLRALVRGTEPAELVQQIRPTAPQYGRLMNVLARLKEVQQAGGWPAVPEGGARRGDSSAVVLALRARLSASEDVHERTLAQRGAARPAVFDRDLFIALQHFQQRHAIDADGALGEKTLEELNHPVDERIAEVRLNMDRWRWLPHQLGDLYVIVNVAGFELAVIEKGRAIEEMNVVVGQQGWETPIFADTLENLVLNPYWNVPASIIEEELAHLVNDPGYLARNNFERTPDGGLRQRPGPRNALGQFKFVFPNKDNIYLHDTPADQLFSRTSRAFSHGCIRLERPRDLAYLLGEKLAGQSPRQIDRLVATGDNRWIKFRRKIPIYVLYFTTWVDDDGTVRYHHDVYGHDEAIGGQTRRFDSRGT